MAQLPPGAREFLKQGALAHIVTLEPDGSPHVSLAWAGADGDEIVFDDEVVERVREGGKVEARRVQRRQRHIADELPVVSDLFRDFERSGRRGE